MEHKTSIGTLGYAVGTGVLVIVLLLVLGITTGFLPWRDSYAENPWPNGGDEIVAPVTSDDPQDVVGTTPAPAPTPSPTPTPLLPTPGITLDEELPTYIVTVAFGKGGSAIPYGANTVVENGSIIVQAVPDEGYMVEEMIVDGENLGAIDRYEIESVNRNHSIYISFERQRNSQPTPTPTPTATPIPEVRPTPTPTPEAPMNADATMNQVTEE